MRNKASPHGGFFNLGTISHGTLRTQDLLRTFADELERLNPFNSLRRCIEARRLADELDAGDYPDAALLDDSGDALDALIDELDRIAGMHGAYFGTSEGDGSDFGFWQAEAEDDDADDDLRNPEGSDNWL